MRFVYLDMDGVMNDHTLMENGYCGISPDCVRRLNRLFDQFEDLHIVVSSAWRYMVLAGDMTRRGYEEMLLTHGVCCYGRVFGMTAPDEPYWSSPPTEADYSDLTVRKRQIADHVREHRPESYVVLDDMELEMDRFVRTDGQKGLQDNDVEAALEVLLKECARAA
jgi:hypothetical protein